MNTFLLYRRIRGPVYLLTFGVTALLAQWHILSFWQSWPLYLIVAGVLRLAEGAAVAASTPPIYAGAPPAAVAGSYQAAPNVSLTTIAPEPAPVSGQTGFTAVPEEKS